MLQGDGYYYWLYNPGTCPRDVLVKSKDLKRDFGQAPNPPSSSLSHAKGPILIFDPNQENDTSLYMYSWSPSGKYWTAILQKAGSDWQNIRTIDTQTGKAVEEDLTGAKFTFGVSWMYDSVSLNFARMINLLINRVLSIKRPSAKRMVQLTVRWTERLGCTIIDSILPNLRISWFGTAKEMTLRLRSSGDLM
jgi:prolyl oligopeptidase